MLRAGVKGEGRGLVLLIFFDVVPTYEVEFVPGADSSASTPESRP